MRYIILSILILFSFISFLICNNVKYTNNDKLVTTFIKKDSNTYIQKIPFKSDIKADISIIKTKTLKTKIKRSGALFIDTIKGIKIVMLNNSIAEVELNIKDTININLNDNKMTLNTNDSVMSINSKFNLKDSKKSKWVKIINTTAIVVAVVSIFIFLY